MYSIPDIHPLYVVHLQRVRNKRLRTWWKKSKLWNKFLFIFFRIQSDTICHYTVGLKECKMKAKANPVGGWWIMKRHDLWYRPQQLVQKTRQIIALITITTTIIEKDQILWNQHRDLLKKEGLQLLWNDVIL